MRCWSHSVESGARRRAASRQDKYEKEAIQKVSVSVRRRYNKKIKKMLDFLRAARVPYDGRKKLQKISSSQKFVQNFFHNSNKKMFVYVFQIILRIFCIFILKKSRRSFIRLFYTFHFYILKHPFFFRTFQNSLRNSTHIRAGYWADCWTTCMCISL